MDKNSKASVKDFSRELKVLHISEEELMAAVQTIKDLATPKSSVVLHVDNQAAFSFLSKGGGERYLNEILKPLLYWCR